VARAKRTNRAEARRRYRAQLVDQARDLADEEVEASEPQGRPTKPAPGGRTAPAATTAQPQPAGIGYAFRAAFHAPNYREDIAYLPKLIVHPAVWAPVLATVATAIAYLATGGTDLISGFAVQYFVAPPPIGAIFIAGFFAPRASYLAGGIVGIVSALVLAGLTAAAPPSLTTGLSPSPSPSISASASPTASGGPGASSLVASPSAPAGASQAASAAPSASPGGSAATAGSPEASLAASPGSSPAPGIGTTRRLAPEEALGYALATSPLSGVFFASAAAWYRRFLRLANPNRGRPPARQAQRRRR
jgi:hypothetical protein